MKIVIDIPNYMYEVIKSSGSGAPKSIDDAIANGTPLPTLPKSCPYKRIVKDCDGDLISRKETIEWLKKVTVTDGITFETGFKQILVDIEQMPSAEKTAEWISVRKQKPKDYEEVIATVRYDYKDKQEYEVVTGVRYSKEDGWEWAYEAGADYYVSLAEEVVAWQPLPKPYKKGTK